MATTATTSASRFGDLAGELAGDDHDSRPPLVFLHGLTFDRTMWGPALAEVRRVDPGRRTLTLDLPGHGESAGAFRGLDAALEQLRDALAAAGVERPVYVGHSIGAMPAMLMALEDGASGIVNVDAVLDVEPILTFIEQHRAEIDSPAFPAIWSGLLDQMLPAGVSEATEALVRGTSSPRSDIAVGYWSTTFEVGAHAASLQVIEAISEVRSRNIPYLIVAGDPPDDGYRAFLARNFPEAGIAWLPHSGHFPHIEHPSQFAALILATGSWPERDDRLSALMPAGQ